MPWITRKGLSLGNPRLARALSTNFGWASRGCRRLECGLVGQAPPFLFLPFLLHSKHAAVHVQDDQENTKAVPRPSKAPLHNKHSSSVAPWPLPYRTFTDPPLTWLTFPFHLAMPD